MKSIVIDLKTLETWAEFDTYCEAKAYLEHNLENNSNLSVEKCVIMNSEED